MIQMREDREIDQAQSAVASGGGFQPTKSCPMRGVITMLPALSPT